MDGCLFIPWPRRLRCTTYRQTSRQRVSQFIAVSKRGSAGRVRAASLRLFLAQSFCWFVISRELRFSGRDAGWTALLVGCVHQTQLDVSTTARYYSATVTLSTVVVFCLWLMITKGEWKHYLLAACAFIALFFTHLITFIAGVSVLCVLAPIMLLRQRGSLKKLTGFALVLAVATVPWILSTGFLSGFGAVPPARLLLSFPSDFFVYPLARPIYFVSFGTLICVLIWAWRAGSGLPNA